MGADPILACPTWPEIKKEALKPCILSAEEGRQLEKIRNYAGSREMHNLFDPSTLRAAGISVLPPSEIDKARPALLAVPLNKDLPKESQGEGSASVKPTVANKPKKRLRGSIVPGDLAGLRLRKAENVAVMGGPSLTVKKEIMEKKRKRSTAESSSATTAEGQQLEDPLPHQAKVIILDEASPPQ